MLKFFLITIAFTSHSYALFTDNPAELMMFMNLIPKGGDLHNHLSGALFLEDYVNIFTKLNYCIDNTTLKVSKNNNSSDCKSFKDLDYDLYKKNGGQMVYN